MYCGGHYFVCGGNQSTGRQPQTCLKSLTSAVSHKVVSSSPQNENLNLLVQIKFLNLF